MPNVYYSDPDLIWIQEAEDAYNRSRGTLDKLIAQGALHPVEFAGDRRRYLRRSELDRVFGTPLRDVPQRNQGAG